MRGGNAAPRNLRSVAVAVAEAVRIAGLTTAAAAAEEVAARVGGGRNVRRRLYDALKVLAAVGVVVRARGTLRWRGVAHLRPGYARVVQKRATAAALAARLALVERYVLESTEPAARVKMPFVLVRAPRGTRVGAYEGCIELDSFFQIVNDSAVIARVAAAPRALPRSVKRRRIDAPPSVSLDLSAENLSHLDPLIWGAPPVIESGSHSVHLDESVATALLNDIPVGLIDNASSDEPLSIDFSSPNEPLRFEFDQANENQVELELEFNIPSEKADQNDQILGEGTDINEVQSPTLSKKENMDEDRSEDIEVLDLDDLEWGPPLLDV